MKKTRVLSFVCLFCLTTVVNAIDADYNGDGIADILIQNSSTGRVKAWLNTATGVQSQFLKKADSNVLIKDVGDFNGDGVSDILVEDTDTRRIKIWFNSDSGTTSQYIKTRSNTEEILAVADMDGDGSTDIVVRNSKNSKAYVWTNVATGIEVQYLKRVSSSTELIASTDMYGVGQDNLVFMDERRRVKVWTLKKSGSLKVNSIRRRSKKFTMVGVADVDGDGKKDIVLQNINNRKVKAWINTWNTKKKVKKTQYIGTVDINSTIVGIANINGNAYDDIILKDNNQHFNAWINSESGATFSAFEGVGQYDQLVDFADYNGDGTDDFLFEDNVTGEVSVWLMQDAGFRYSDLKTLGKDEKLLLTSSERNVSSTNILQTGQVIEYESFDDGYHQKGMERTYTRDTTNETVSETGTGLMWQDDENALSLLTTHDDAITYCTDLTLSGFTDWRLPTMHELVYLTDQGRSNPSLNSIFENVSPNYYWSSTLYANNSSKAWILYAYDGGVQFWSTGYTLNLRCVRDEN